MAAGGIYVGSVVARAGRPGVAVAADADVQFIALADGTGRVVRARLAEPAGSQGDTDQRCERVYTAASSTVCLRLSGPGPSFEAVVESPLRPPVRVPLPGTPSRAQVSRSGNVASFTSFVTGDSYLVPGGFSTRSGVVDVRTGAVIDSVEGFAATVAGVPVTATDRNYWGITVADDDRTFYATLGSGGRTWLMRGDLATRTLVDVRPDAECPSLSPDGTRVAYKKRIGRFGPWDMAVLDLATGTEIRLPGTAGIDDQAAWLDPGLLAYASSVGAGAPSIYTVPADGTAEPELLVPDAASPSVVGPAAVG